MEWFLDDDDHHSHRHCHEDHYDTDSALMRMIIMIADCWSWINLGIILLRNPHRPGQSKTWDQSIGKGFKTCNPNAQCLSVHLGIFFMFLSTNQILIWTSGSTGIRIIPNSLVAIKITQIYRCIHRCVIMLTKATTCWFQWPLSVLHQKPHKQCWMFHIISYQPINHNFTDVQAVLGCSWTLAPWPVHKSHNLGDPTSDFFSLSEPAKSHNKILAELKSTGIYQIFQSSAGETVSFNDFNSNDDDL